jgi:hypothetical protein
MICESAPVETALSMVTVLWDRRSIHYRFSNSFQGCLASVVAVFNVLLTLFHQLPPEAEISL